MILLNKREVANIGIQGEDGDYVHKKRFLVLFAKEMSLLGTGLPEGADSIETAMPGDLIQLRSFITLRPKGTLVLAQFNPLLYEFGLVSAPTAYNDDVRTEVKASINVQEQFEIGQLDYLCKLFSLGDI